jgi:hypothetical protein
MTISLTDPFTVLIAVASATNSSGVRVLTNPPGPGKHHFQHGSSRARTGDKVGVKTL